MTLPRGLLGIYACRPRRPALERDAVREAAAALVPDASARRAGLALARLVLARTLEFAEAEPGSVDYLRGVMVRVAPTTALDVLATHPAIDTAGMIRAARLARFEARGCRQLGPADWQVEGREIVRAAAPALARRYSRHLAER